MLNWALLLGIRMLGQRAFAIGLDRTIQGMATAEQVSNAKNTIDSVMKARTPEEYRLLRERA